MVPLVSGDHVSASGERVIQDRDAAAGGGATCHHHEVVPWPGDSADRAGTTHIQCTQRVAGRDDPVDAELRSRDDWQLKRSTAVPVEPRTVTAGGESGVDERVKNMGNRTPSRNLPKATAFPSRR